MNEDIKNNIERVRYLIGRAAESSGRKQEDITIVAVSKKQPLEKVFEAYHAGINIFGENRVQEFLSKFSQSTPGPHWHMVGHLQTNKAGKLIGKVDLIQSVDSINLINRLSSLAVQQQETVEILLQVNTSGEMSKSGFEADMVEHACEIIEQSEGVLLRGLMTIGPLTENEKEISASFSRLRDLFEYLKKFKSSHFNLSWLSMGMSGDFELAIKEGSNLVRIGTAIFGPRLLT